MTDDLRLGVIGFGLRGDLARTAHRPGYGARVTAVADPDPDALAYAGRCFPGAETFADHRALLHHPGLDALLLLTPDHTHADLARQALHAGRPVFVEKPLAISIEDCDAILRTAHETGTRLYVGHNMRHMPVIRLMRELITRGDIGRVRTVWVRHFVGHGGDYYFKDWHAERRHTNGLLLQKGAHDLDALHWLANGYTRQVQALGDLTVYGDPGMRRAPGEPRPEDWLAHDAHWPPGSQRGLNPRIDVEDVSLVNMRLDNGVLAAYQQCHFSPELTSAQPPPLTCGNNQRNVLNPSASGHRHERIYYLGPEDQNPVDHSPPVRPVPAGEGKAAIAGPGDRRRSVLLSRCA